MESLAFKIELKIGAISAKMPTQGELIIVLKDGKNYNCEYRLRFIHLEDTMLNIMQGNVVKVDPSSEITNIN